MPSFPERVQQRWRALPPVPRIILTTLAIVVLLHLFRPQAPVKPVQDNSPRVSTREAVVTRFQPQLLLFGHIQSPASATLSSSVSAVVEALPYLAGSPVQAGDKLVALDTREASLALAQAQAALDSANAKKQATLKRIRSDRNALALEEKLTRLAEENLARIEQLRRDQLASQTQVDEARQSVARQQLSLETRRLAVQNHDADLQQLDADIARTQAQVTQAQLDLERSSVLAPFSGRVTTLHVAPGERVRPGDPLVSLYAEQGVEIRAQIPQRYLPEIRQALANGDALGGTLFLEQQTAGLVLQRLAGEVQQGQGGVDGLFQLMDSNLTPELGRPLELTLSLPARDGLVAVPAASLHGLDRIYTLDDQERLKAIRVERVGEWRNAEGDRLLLLKGASDDSIRDGMPLVMTQLPGAIDGMKVQPVTLGKTLSPDVTDTTVTSPEPLPDEPADSPATDLPAEATDPAAASAEPDAV